jgi:hypothetical protein
MSTIALQDIVECQKRTTNGLVTLLSQEQKTASAESNTRVDTSNSFQTSQHFLILMSDEIFYPLELDPHQLHES